MLHFSIAIQVVKIDHGYKKTISKVNDVICEGDGKYEVTIQNTDSN